MGSCYDTKEYPNQEDINNLFKYNNGELYWIANGKRAGCIRKDGYCQISIKRRLYYRHRLIWIMFNGPIPNNMLIDHKNGVYEGDNINNLQCITMQHNSSKQLRINKKTSNMRGVYWNKTHNKWHCNIKYNKKSIWIGAFDNEIDAGLAYNKKSKELFGEYAYQNEIA